MAFVRALVLACAAASCAAFNPAVSAFGRVGSLRKSVSYAPAARTAPLSNHRAASASQIAMKGYEIDLTGKVLPLLVFCNPSLLFTTLRMQACIEQQMVKSVFRPCLVHVCLCVCVRPCAYRSPSLEELGMQVATAGVSRSSLPMLVPPSLSEHGPRCSRFLSAASRRDSARIQNSLMALT